MSIWGKTAVVGAFEHPTRYAPDKTAGVREFSRIVRPGDRLAFFTFELDAEKVLGLE